MDFCSSQDCGNAGWASKNASRVFFIYFLAKAKIVISVIATAASRFSPDGF